VIIEVKSLPPKSGTNGVSERKKLMNGLIRVVKLKQKNGRIRKMIRYRSIVFPKVGTNEIDSNCHPF